MSHNTDLTFGPLVTIKITRDSRKRISTVESSFRNSPDGFILSLEPSTQEGSFKAIHAENAEEVFKAQTVHYSSPQEDQPQTKHLDFEVWLDRCMQKMIGWARALAISTAYEAITVGNYELAAETYRDVLDHFPPPPDAPLLYWLYYCCRMHLSPDDDVREFLLLWFSEALELSGLEAYHLVLEPARELLGKEKAVALAKKWLERSSLHDPTHKRTKRWLMQIEHSPLGNMSWEQHGGKPFKSQDSTIINCPDGNVVVLGGLDETGLPTNKAALWNIQDKEWTLLPDMPFPRHRHAAVALWDGSVVVMGGTIVREGQTERFSSSVICYKPQHQEWIDLSPLLIGREYLSAISFRGRILVIGGESPFQLDALIEVWDRRAKSWVPSASPKIRFKKAVLHNHHGNIIITGPSVSVSGFGALSLHPSQQTITSFENLRGAAIDGLFPLQSDELMIWNRQAEGLRLGIWSSHKDDISWTLPEIIIPERDDLLQILSCEDDQFLVVYQKESGACGFKLLHPHRSFVEDLQPPQEEHQLAYLSCIHLVDGQIMLTDHNSTSVVML